MSEELQAKIKEQKQIKMVLRGGSIGVLALLYVSLSKINKTPFKQDMVKYYVPAIEMINENHEKSTPVLEPRKQTEYDKRDIELLIQYNTSWEKQNNGLYEQKQIVYAYQNIKEEDIIDIINNLESLEEYLTKKSELSFYAKDVPLENNYPKYNIELINEGKSIYQYKLESKKDALIDTSIFLTFLCLTLRCLRGVNKCIDERIKDLEMKDKIVRKLTR